MKKSIKVSIDSTEPHVQTAPHFKNQKNNYLIILGILALLLVVGASTYYLRIQRNGDSTYNTKENPLGSLTPTTETSTTPTPLETTGQPIQKVEAPFPLSFSLPEKYIWKPYEYGKAPNEAKIQYGGGTLEPTGCETPLGWCPVIELRWEWDTYIVTDNEKEQMKRGLLSHFTANQCFYVLPEEFSEITVADKKVLVFNGSPRNSCPDFEGKTYEKIGFTDYIQKNNRWYSIAIHYDNSSTPTEAFSHVIQTLNY